MKKKQLKKALPIIIIAVGVGIYFFQSFSRQKPKRGKSPELPILVEVVKIEPWTEPISLHAKGTVIPARSVTLAPEISGKVVAIHPDLRPGGRVNAGQELIRIDSKDYDLIMQQQRAVVAQARQQLAQERGLKAVADAEWRMMRDPLKPTGEGKRLVLREIQLESAEAALISAQSNFERAKLNRARTIISAPFNAVIIEKLVDVGQVVAPGTRLIRLVGIDYFWVRVSVPTERLVWIDLPELNNKLGSTARIRYQLGPNNSIVKSGQVLNLLGDLDPQGKMARLLVRINQPLSISHKNKEESVSQDDLIGLTQTPSTSLPVLLGAYVDVEISGPKILDVFNIPRQALRAKNRVWVKTQENTLATKNVEVVWSRLESVLIRGDLKTGDEIVLSRIVVPVEGMQLFTPEQAILLKAQKIKNDGNQKPAMMDENAGKAKGNHVQRTP